MKRVMVIVLGVVLMTSLGPRGAGAEFGDLSSVEASRQQEDAQRKLDLEARLAQSQEKAKRQAECDADSEACFDQAGRNLRSCGSAEACQGYFLRDKKRCGALLEKCESSLTTEVME